MNGKWTIDDRGNGVVVCTTSDKKDIERLIASIKKIQLLVGVTTPSMISKSL